jgi:hypothetical protein
MRKKLSLKKLNEDQDQFDHHRHHHHHHRLNSAASTSILNNASLNYTNAQMTSSNNINFMHNNNNNNNHNQRSRSRSNSTGTHLINENNKRKLVNDNLVVSDLTLERNPKKGMIILKPIFLHGRHFVIIIF